MLFENLRNQMPDVWSQMVSLSPLMSNFGALLDGLATVRGISPPFELSAMNHLQGCNEFLWLTH